MRWIPLLLVLAPTLLGGCDRSAGVGATHIAEGDLDEAEKGKVLAKVGDARITLEDFERRLEQQSPFARARYNSLERKREFLDSLVRFELLALDAEKKGFGEHPDVVLARKQAMVKRLSADELANLVKIGDITDADVKAYYDEHSDEFNKPAEVRASHILLPLTAEGAAQALHAEITQAIAAEPLQARKVFARLAAERTTDEKTKAQGGDLQFFGEPGVSRVERDPGQPDVPPAVAKAAFALEQVGDLAPLVRTSAGWHLVQKTGFRQPYTRELEDVATSIRNKLFRARKGQAMQDYVKGLRDSATVTIDEAALAAIEVAAPKGEMPYLGPPKIGPDGRLIRPSLPRPARPEPTDLGGEE